MQRQRNSRVIISEFLSSVIPKGDTERPNEGTGQAKGYYRDRNRVCFFFSGWRNVGKRWETSADSTLAGEACKFEILNRQLPRRRRKFLARK